MVYWLRNRLVITSISTFHRATATPEPAPTTGGATTKVSIIELPEASNGGNGLDDPRKRKSVAQAFKDMWTKLR